MPYVWMYGTVAWGKTSPKGVKTHPGTVEISFSIGECSANGPPVFTCIHWQLNEQGVKREAGARLFVVAAKACLSVR